MFKAHEYIFYAMILVLPKTAFSNSTTEEAADLLSQIEYLYQHENAHMKAKLIVKRPNISWEYQLEIMSMGRNNTYIRVLSPLDLKGRAYLKAGKDLWWFHPSELRERQVSRTGSLRRFLKSEFSRDDLLMINRLDEEYDINIHDQGEKQKIILTPKMLTPIVWDKLEFELDSDTGLPLSKSYFNERGLLAKKLSYQNPQEVDGYLVPTVLEMKSYMYKGYVSRLELSDIVFDGGFDPRIFTINHLVNSDSFDQ